MAEYIDLTEARAFVEANYQGDPMLRHLYGTLLEKLPRVEQEAKQPHGDPGLGRCLQAHHSRLPERRDRKSVV